MDCPFSQKPRWMRRKHARPQELLAAGLTLFVERGYAATRLDDVAKRAGVSKGTLYLYYANKEELFKAVVRDNMVPLLGEAEQLVADYQGSSIDLFRSLVMGWWERVGDTPLSGLCKLVIAESGNFPDLARFYHEEVILRGNAMMAKVLERGMAQGEFRQVDAAQMTQVIVAPVLMLMMWRHSFGACQLESLSPQHYLQQVIDLCLHGLLPAEAVSLPQVSSLS